MVFPFRKSLFGFILILMLGFPFLYAFIEAFRNSRAVPYAIILGALCVYQIWVIIGSKCYIKNKKLTVKVGPFVRSVLVKDIMAVEYRIVEQGTMRKMQVYNLLISHPRGEYFVPTVQGEKLLDELRARNPKIKINKVQFGGK